MIQSGFEGTPMKALACVAGLLALLFAISLRLPTAARNPDELRVLDQWARVETLQLPDATLAEITGAFGPGDSEGPTTYHWCRFVDSYGHPSWMLSITVDPETNEVIAYARQAPWIRDDGTVDQTPFDAASRDKQGTWRAGPMPMTQSGFE